jgi:hypothetical protein
MTVTISSSEPPHGNSDALFFKPLKPDVLDDAVFLGRGHFDHGEPRSAQYQLLYTVVGWDADHVDDGRVQSHGARLVLPSGKELEQPACGLTRSLAGMGWPARLQSSPSVGTPISCTERSALPDTR